MSLKYGTAAGAATFAFTLLLLPAVAATVITEREKRDCQADYHRYCSEYGLGSEALRACMSRSIKKISSMCVAALVDADAMTQSQADRLRQRTKTVKHPRYKKVAYQSSKKKH